MLGFILSSCVTDREGAPRGTRREHAWGVKPTDRFQAARPAPLAPRGIDVTAPTAPVNAPTAQGVRNALLVRALVVFGVAIGRAVAKAERAAAALAKATAKAVADGKPAPLAASVARAERDRRALGRALVAFGVAVKRADHDAYLASLPVWVFGPGRVTGNGIPAPHRAQGPACRRVGGGSAFGSRCVQDRAYFSAG